MVRECLFCWLENDSRIEMEKTGEDDFNIHLVGKATGTEQDSSVWIWGDREKMWRLATTILDTLMEEEELTEADLATMDKAAAKMGFYIQDAEVCNGS